MAYYIEKVADKAFTIVLLIVSFVSIYYLIFHVKNVDLKLAYMPLAVAPAISILLVHSLNLKNLKAIQSFVKIEISDFNKIIITMSFLFYVISVIYVCVNFLYIGGTDTLGHLSMIDNIIFTKHCVMLDIYNYFPLSHIFLAMISTIANINYIYIYFIVGSFFVVLSIIFIYKIIFKLSNNNLLSLIIAYIYTFSPFVFYYSIYPVPRSRAYVLLLMAFYLLLISEKNINNKIFYILSIFVILSAMLYHHATILQMALLFLITGITCYLLDFVSKFINNNNNKFDTLICNRYIFISKFCLLFGISYMFLVAFTQYTPVIKGIYTMLSTLNSQLEVASNPPVSKCRFDFINLLIENIYYGIVLVLTIVGVKIGFDTLINKKRCDFYKLLPIIFVGALLLVIYIPNPINTNHVFVYSLGLYRLRLFISPWIATCAGFGLYVLLLKIKSSKTLKIPAIFLMAVLIVSVPVTTTFIMNNAHREYQPTKIIYPSEIISSYWLLQHSNNNSKVFSDYIFARYIKLYLNSIRFIKINKINGGMPYKPELLSKYIDNKNHIYFVYRKGEFMKSKVLLFGWFGQTEPYYFTNKSYERMNKILYNFSKIYVGGRNEEIYRS